MSEWFLKKLNIIGSIIAIIVLFGVIIYAANIEIKDLDLWLHLATGKYIFQNFSIPKVDILSATISGAPWVNHEWLFQFVVYSVFDSFGVDGLIALQVVLVGLIFSLLLMLGYNDKMQLIPVIVLFWVFMVFQLRFTHRPDLFSLLFFVVYFLILGSQFESKISLVVLFFIQVLWNNIHGFFILGPVIIFLGLLGEWLKRHMPMPFEWNKMGRLQDAEYLKLKYAFGIVILASLLNPHFIEGALYPLKVFLSVSGESQIFFQHISELQKPISLNNLFLMNRFFYYKLLIVFSAVTFALNYKKIDVGLLLFWIFFLFFSLSANRNILYFAVAAYFVIIANSQQIIFSEKGKKWLSNKKIIYIFSFICKGLLIVVMFNFGRTLSLRGYFDFDKNVRKFEYEGGLSLRNFPYKAVDFLIEHDVEGKFFNDFNSGAYLLGRCFPDIKVYIDGRTEVYGPDYFREYQQAYDGDVELLKRILARYPLTGAFLGSVYAPASRNTLKYFYESEEWALVYFDYDATIFLKRVPKNEGVISRQAIDLLEKEIEENDLVAIGVNRVTPYRNINRANAYLHLGFNAKAKEEAEQAIKVSPYYIEAYEVIAKINFQDKDYLKALENFRKVKLLGKDDAETAFKIAQCFFEIGAYRRAKEQCRKILEGKNDASALSLLALISVKEGKIQRGFDLAKQAYSLSSSTNVYLKEIGDFFFDSKDFLKAQELYQAALKMENDRDKINELNQKISFIEGQLSN